MSILFLRACMITIDYRLYHVRASHFLTSQFFHFFADLHHLKSLTHAHMSASTTPPCVLSFLHSNQGYTPFTAVILQIAAFCLPLLLLPLIFYRDVEMLLRLGFLKLQMMRYMRRKTVADFWERHLSTRQKKEFLIFEQRSFTYGEVDGKANEVCAFREMGDWTRLVERHVIAYEKFLIFSIFSKQIDFPQDCDVGGWAGPEM